jgi:hypothetical protein
MECVEKDMDFSGVTFEKLKSFISSREASAKITVSNSERRSASSTLS